METDDLARKWKAKLAPMKGPQWPIAYRRQFTPAEIEALKAGLWPRDMDDRWCIWLDGGVLRLWRSWTRTCVYELPIQEAEDGSGQARVAIVLDAQDQYHRSPTEEGELHRLAGVLSLMRYRETAGV